MLAIGCYLNVYRFFEVSGRKVESTLLVSRLISVKQHSKLSVAAVKKDTKPVILYFLKGFASLDGFSAFFAKFSNIVEISALRFAPCAFQDTEGCFEWFTMACYDSADHCAALRRPSHDPRGAAGP